jgi:predicted dehydrogenase
MSETRRAFLRSAAAVAAAAASGGCQSLFRTSARQRSANERLNLGVIGVGGRGAANLSAALESGERIAALCDVDETALLAGREKVAGRCPEVRLYKDFRKLFEAETALDAVLISTPDHGHALQASWALDKRCHVYVETPLARTLGEVRYLREKARSRGAVIQVGDHGSSTAPFLRALEVLQSGLLGKVTEAHVWTSRPVWPQGIRRPAGSDPVPATLDWDLWLAGAPERPFKSKVYHRFNWRGWHDFGTGALGDAGCQALSLAFRMLKLEAPVTVEATETAERLEETYPRASAVRFGFAARGKLLPPVTVQWYDGNGKPSAELMPQVLAAYGKIPPSGSLLVGENGVWVTTDDLCTRHALALRGETRVRDIEAHEACRAVPVSLPRVQSHQQAFFDAIRNSGKTISGMDFAVPLTECVLAGCVAQRIPGRLEWNSRKGRFTKQAEANRLVAPVPREGWRI